MKIIVLIILSIFFFNLSYTQIENADQLSRSIHNFVNDPSLKNAAISIKVIDLNDASTVAAHQPEMSLAPASTMKLFSTALAFEHLGAYYRPETSFYIDGDIDSSGVLEGNIWIKGGGDPSLGSRFFNKRGEERAFLHQVVDSILSKGITKINGSIIADGSRFGYKGAPEGWSWGDMGNYYGAGPAGCTLFDNMTYLSFHTSKKLNDTTNIKCMDPYVSGISFYNTVTTSKSQRDNAYVYGAPYSLDRFVVGSLPFGKESFEVKASIPDPEMLLAQEVQYELAQKIAITNPPNSYRMLSYNKPKSNSYDDRKLLFIIKGETVKNIAYWTNMRSVNLFAEQLLCLVGLEKTGSGTTESSIYFADKHWESKISSGLRISDGCGLSRKNLANAGNFCDLLKYVRQSPIYEDFLETLPTAGKTGTLSRICRGQAADGRIMAKSGTMNRIKSYSGYVKTTSGKELAFAIIVNGHDISSSALVKKMEPFFNAMARYQ